MRRWEEYQVSHPETHDIIEKGLEKMAEYKNRMDLVPAYVLAMGKEMLNPMDYNKALFNLIL